MDLHEQLAAKDARIAELEAQLAAAPSLGIVEAVEPKPWHKVETVVMDGHQLREALELLNPDGDEDRDQLDDELTFGIVQHKDDDGVVSTGLCCWNDDMDGVYPLHGDGPYASTMTVMPASRALQPADTYKLRGAIMSMLMDIEPVTFANWTRAEQDAYRKGFAHAQQAAAELVAVTKTTSTGAAVAVQASGQQVPDGYKLVPIEPTLEMIAAFAFKGDVEFAIGHAAIFQEACEDYAEMLAAAPIAASMAAVPGKEGE